MKVWSSLRVGAVVAAVVACADATPPAVRMAVATPSCAATSEAPLRAADGSLRCTRVGAQGSTAATPWPDVRDLPTPVVYVRPGLSGDGSIGAPYGDLASALRAGPPPASIALGAGTYDLDGGVELTRPLVVRGVGVDVTTLRGAVTARGGVPVTLMRLSLTGAGFDVVGSGTRLTLQDVSVQGGAYGARVQSGATLCATGVTVRGATQRGLLALEGAAVFLRDFVVRDGVGVGVLVDRAHLFAERGLVAANGRDGVAIRGARRGAVCLDDGDCAATTPCEGFEYTERCVADLGATPARRCRSVDLVTDVALLRNTVTGLRTSRSTPTSDEVTAGRRDEVLSYAGPLLLATRVIVGATLALPGTPGGDGVYVGPGATVAFDADTSSDAARGLRSATVGNARTGLLVDGDRTTDATVPDRLRQAGRLVLAGALVASNEGPGLFVQERAVAERVAFSELRDNAALGVGVTSNGASPLMVCNRFIGTRLGTITPEDTSLRPFMVGDGVSLTQGAATTTRTRLVDNEFNDNRRFGLVLDGYDATLDDGAQGGNRGRNNGFGLAAYGTARLDGTTPRTAILGASPAPAVAETVRDRVAVANGP